MPDRYTFHDHDTHGVVVDTQTGEATRYDLVRDAEDAARRLNAGAPKRAKEVVAWAMVDADGAIQIGELAYDRDWIRDDARVTNRRIARVRISEIEQEASDGE